MTRKTNGEKPHKAGSDFDVGYGKPPVHTRFQPGRSGNPHGRPKGTNNLKTDLVQELGERVKVVENGRQITLTKQRLVVKSLTAKAVKGDTKAASILIGLLAQTLGLDPQDESEQRLDPEDEAILEHFVARAASKSMNGGG
jgi:hypothetical protein